MADAAQRGESTRRARLAVAALVAAAWLPAGAVGLVERAGLAVLLAVGVGIGGGVTVPSELRRRWWAAWGMLLAATLPGLLPVPGAVAEVAAPGVVALWGADGFHLLGSWPHRWPEAVARLTLLAGTGALALGAWRGVSAAAARRIVAWAGAAVLVVGAAHAATGTTRWFGLVALRPADGPIFGPLINPNHYGTLLLLAWPAFVGEAIAGRGPARPLWWLAVAWVVAFPVVSASMGVALALVVVAGVAVLERAPGRIARWGGAFAAVGAGVVAAWRVVEEQPAWWRLSAEPRAAQWADTFAILRAHPLAGLGAGAYGDGYPPFRTVPAFATFEHAHSDPLEWVAETGLIGAVALGAAALVAPRPMAGAGGTALRYGLLGAGVHALVDFPLQVPGVAVAVVVVAAGWLVAGHAAALGPARETAAVGRPAVAAGVQVTLAVVLLALAAVDAEAERVLRTNDVEGAERLGRVAPWRAEPDVVRLQLAAPEVRGGLAQEAAARHPDDAAFLRVAAGLVAEAGDPDTARGLLAMSLTRDPNDYRAWRLSAILAARAGEPAVAAEAAAEAFRHWPREVAADGAPLEQAYGWLPLGVWWVDRLSDAPAHWSMRLAWLMLREGDPETALLAAEQAARLRPEAHRWSSTQADALFRLGRVDALAAYVTAWRQAQPESPWLPYALSLLAEARPSADTRSATTVALLVLGPEISVMKRADACLRAPPEGDGAWCDPSTVGAVLDAVRAARAGDRTACERALRDAVDAAPWLDRWLPERRWTCARP